MQQVGIEGKDISWDQLIENAIIRRAMVDIFVVAGITRVIVTFSQFMLLFYEFFSRGVGEYANSPGPRIYFFQRDPECIGVSAISPVVMRL